MRRRAVERRRQHRTGPHRRAHAVAAQAREPGQAGDPRPWFEFRWTLALGETELSQTDFEHLVDAKTPLVFIDR